MYCTVLCMSYWSTAVKAWLSRWRVCSGYCVPVLSDHLWVCAEGFRGWYAESWYYSWYFSCLFNSSSPSAHIAIHCCPVSHLCSVLVWIQMFPCILTHSHKQNILLCKCFLKPLLCHIISVQVIQKHWSWVTNPSLARGWKQVIVSWGTLFFCSFLSSFEVLHIFYDTQNIIYDCPWLCQVISHPIKSKEIWTRLLHFQGSQMPIFSVTNCG